MIWFAIAIMTALALAIPLAALVRAPMSDDRRARELAIYRHQLAELEEERRSGMIGDGEAEGARLEVERRMLRADAERPRVNAGRGWPATSVAILLMMGIAAAMPLYLGMGHPGLESAPAERNLRETPPSARSAGEDSGDGQPSMADLVDRLSARMAEDPGRLEGWRLLGRSALNSGRPALAADAYARAIELAPEEGALHAALGEALVALTQGQVTPAAELAFERAAKREPANPAAGYYLGLAALQAGEPEAALERWKRLLARAPDDAGWRPAVESQIARLERTLAPAPQSPAPGPDEETLRQAEEMSPEERRAMIVSMVERLADRLENNPDDYQGWIRLARARIVLGDETGAIMALDRAREYAPRDLKEEIDRQRALIEN